MTVRNIPESTSMHLSKTLGGNCTLSDTEKEKLSFQVFRKDVPAGGTEAVYMPIMTEETDPAGNTVVDPVTEEPVMIIDPRFTGIRGLKKRREED